MLSLALFGAIACTRPLHAQLAGTGETTQPHVAANFDWPLLTLSGERTSLAAFRGRVVVINHWATWCAPCIAELPSLAALRAAVPDSGLVFLLVTPQARAPVQQFVRQHRIALPVFLEAKAAPHEFALEAVPTTWILDRDGMIVFKRRGAMQWDTAEMEAYLRRLLSARTALPPHSER